MVNTGWGGKVEWQNGMYVSILPMQPGGVGGQLGFEEVWKGGMMRGGEGRD